MKIDSHQHFWKYNERDFGWISDAMKDIRKDFLPECLKPVLSQSGYDATVAVQARQSTEETGWLLDLASQYDFISGVVGWVDLCSVEVEKQLEHFAANPKFVGVRHVLHDEPDLDFMFRPEFLHGISKLSKYHLTYDILIFPQHLPNTLQFVKSFPNQTFILDHIAKPDIRNRVLSPWKENMHRLAQCPNVFCKVSGMVTEADIKSWQPEDFRPYLDVVFDSFGTERLMIGSDWPVCTVAGSYGKIMEIAEDYISKLSDDGQTAVFGRNAKQIYNL